MREYLFKTIYKNEFIFCIPCFNEVYRDKSGNQGGTDLELIGFCTSNDPSSLPIFEYIGKKDIRGSDIYRGHILFKDGYKAIVQWSEKYVLYNLNIIFPENRNFEFDQFTKELNIQNHGLFKSEEWEIIGHEAFK